MPRIIALLLLATLLTAVEPVVPKETLEPVYGVRFTTKELVFQVRNKGYTDRNAFRLDVSRDPEKNTTTVSLMRIKIDDAKMLPEVIEVHFPLQESGLGRNTPIHLANTLLPAAPIP